MAPTAQDRLRPGRGPIGLLCTLGLLILLLGLTTSAQTSPRHSASTLAKDGKSRSGKQGKGHARRSKSVRGSRRARARANARADAKSARRKRQLRLRKLRRANRSVSLSRNSAVGPKKKAASTGALLDAGFENGLLNWNTAGVGDVIPIVTGDIVRSGVGSGRFALSGSQGRSELILGGDGGGSVKDAILFREGAEYYYSFSFNIQSMVYGRPGAHNLIMQLKGDDSGSPAFGLQLWDYEGDDGHSGGRGLWSHSDAMGGDRFLAPVAEGAWHDVVVHFRAAADAGLYEVFLNGQLIDARSGVGTIPDGASYVYIKSGLYRNGGTIPGTSEIRLDAVRLGTSMASVLPG